MGYIVLTRELAVDLVNDQGAVTRQNVIVPQGQRVPNNVAPHLLNALRSAGVLAFVDDGPISTPTIREVEPPMQVRTPDLPPELPSDPVGSRVATGEVDAKDAKPATVQFELGNLDPKDTIGLAGGGTVGGQKSGGEAADDKPKASDNKEAWEAYAVKLGVPQGEAESMTKPKLQEAVAKREREQSKA